ncbi:GYDIA family GHMP kinase [Winogradskyella alexanderae]|uniref:GHMP kinase n=1 Tax=Winogradskyella alexanderae TaxID=2877123 RepID=A0ABS7XR53_9FLAO|nr:GYDIA family GHMP kinase [Winogradskyella alexanderae]MCA0132483.1 GHMP kinase [Winogradskyella alexanderae]
MKTFKSNGKLLLTAEYVVLDGAKALALPSRYGQSLSVSKNDKTKIHWQSYNEKNEIWFEDEIETMNGELKSKQLNHPVSERLIQILNAAKELNSDFLNNSFNYKIVTRQDFNRLWGLGTSSTLINNIAQWAKVDAYELLALTFGGSGYDIACAQHNCPITYKLDINRQPVVHSVPFEPSFMSHLYFVYLEQKQNSRDGIKAYRSRNKVDVSTIEKINNITESILGSATLEEFNELIEYHEYIIANLLAKKPIKQELFNDFEGTIKSLGAWGGDFVLVASKTNPTTYFKSKGFPTVIPYKEMVL